jgi:phenylpropionate dioxygenase-like ring-hydroxylating dioxygenase large terminal subunit
MYTKYIINILLIYNLNCAFTKSNPKHFQFGNFPRLDKPNHNGQLTWYNIGFKSDFTTINSNKITIRDKNYAIWNDNNNFYAIKDTCSHQGSSFTCGLNNVKDNLIICPYHGYTFNNNGDLINIPNYNYKISCNTKIESFRIINKYNSIFINTIPINSNIIDETSSFISKKKDEITLEEKQNFSINETLIWIEPEATNINQKVVLLSKEFEHNAKFVSVNSLDICHIGFVHSFGNKDRPNPISMSKIEKMDNYHYKISYQYIAGDNSLVKKFYNQDIITVENEYILPHTTVARVIFGNFTSTIITNALPVSKFKTKLFVKAYRNYLYFPIEENDVLYIFKIIINFIGDVITFSTMENTLNEDKNIIDNIDKTNYNGMHGNFSIKYDRLSSHYKAKYKLFYEYNDTIL